MDHEQQKLLPFEVLDEDGYRFSFEDSVAAGRATIAEARREAMERKHDAWEKYVGAREDYEAFDEWKVQPNTFVGGI